MKQSIALMVGAAVIAAALSSPALSQGTPQTLSIMKVDPASLTTGYRTSKVVGSTVVNEANETVGTIDDLIVTPSEKVPFAVLSVGGFLGMGTKRRAGLKRSDVTAATNTFQILRATCMGFFRWDERQTLTPEAT